jgi:hypothetical protein
MATVEQRLLDTSTFAGSAAFTLATDWQHDPRLKGLILITDVDTVSASADMTITLEVGKAGPPPASDAQSRLAAYTVIATPAITTSGLSILKVFPGASAVANQVANEPMPPRWRVVASLSASSTQAHDFKVDAYKILGD